MNLGVLLDVAVSVLAVMILFSLAAAAINEFVTDYLLKLRGRTLEEAICRLLAEKDEVPGDTAPEKARRFFDDPDVRALMQGARRPSAIEPRRYALTVLKLLGRRDALAAQAEGELREVREAILAALPKGATQAAVEQALEAAAARTTAFRTTLDRQVAVLEREFSEAMDRASGWYLRRTRLSLFVIGLAMAVGANVDLLHYADRLMTHADVRDKAAIYSQMLGDSWLEELAPMPPAGQDGSNGNQKTVLQQAQDQSAQLVSALEGLDVRLGWKCRAKDEGEWGNPIDYLPLRLGGCDPGTSYGAPSPSQVMGWFIIAFGVTLGAQFWFDLFRRAVQMRTSGMVSSTQRADETTSARG